MSEHRQIRHAARDGKAAGERAGSRRRGDSAASARAGDARASVREPRAGNREPRERASYPDWYEAVSAPFRSEIAERFRLDVPTGPSAKNGTISKTAALVALIAVAYAAAVLMLVVAGDVLRAVRVIAVPALTLALVSYLRKRWDAPRPYDLYDIDPIIHKDERGKSMPSRHVSSAVIIACALAWLHLDWGVLAFVACAIVAFTRIIGGVHFPRDVAAGVAIALVCGILGFVVIPS